MSYLPHAGHATLSAGPQAGAPPAPLRLHAEAGYLRSILAIVRGVVGADETLTLGRPGGRGTAASRLGHPWPPAPAGPRYRILERNVLVRSWVGVLKTMSGVPSSTTTPSSIMTTRLATSRAKPIS